MPLLTHPHQRTVLRAIILPAAAVFASLFAHANAEPEWRAKLNSPTAGNFPALRPTVLDYQLSWRGTINAGTLRMEVDPPEANKPGRHVIRTTARSTGAAATLFPYEHHFWAEIRHNTYKPVYFQGTETDRRATEETRVRYFPDRVESHERKTHRRGGRVTEQEKVFRHRDIHNIFSVLFHIRSQDLSKGRKFSVICQPFDKPYLITVESHGAEMHGDRSAIRCTVSMDRIDPETLELREYEKLRRPATLWLTNDAHRVILEVRAAVFIGDVRATLVNQKKP